MRIDQSFLRSRVARRVFLAFVLCALVPLAAQAWFSNQEVRSELARQATERLHADSKSAAMTMVERVQYLEADLIVLASELRRGGNLESVLAGIEERIDLRFEGLALAEHDGSVLASMRGALDPPEWTPDERRFLDSGRTLLTSRPNPGGFPRVFLARSARTPERPDALLLARVSPDYLWGGAALQLEGTELFVFDQLGRLLYASRPDALPFESRSQARPGEHPDGPLDWLASGEEFTGASRTVFMRPQFLANWVLVRGQTLASVLRPLANFQRDFVLVTLLSFWVVLFLSVRLIRRNLVPIEALRDATRRLSVRDFSQRLRIESGDEFEELGTAFNNMADSLGQHIEVLQGLHGIGLTLTAEKDSRRLCEAILTGAERILRADSVLLYLRHEDGHLELSLLTRTAGSEPSRPEASAQVDLATGSRPRSAARHAIQRGGTLHVSDIHGDHGLDLSADLELHANIGLSAGSLLSVPMRDHEGRVNGLLQLINRRDAGSDLARPFDRDQIRLAESIAAQAAVALTKNELVEDFRRVFVSLTEMIAMAIDEKSPYTGDHCRRVPALTMMLAESADRARSGPLADFELSEEELYELRVAAHLHDCGKVVTPVHVVDKATKLEAIFDRMQLVDARLEVLKRDAHVEVLRSSLKRAGGNPDSPSLRRRLRRRTAELDAVREFLRRCNDGVEHMPEADRERVREIARELSWASPEGERLPLLSDEEIHNLTVVRGTLTAEEREVINNHVVVTIKMLEHLRFPRSLERVPLLAGAHHERMDGSGYPRGLTREQIPVQGRMIGLADVFEALTDEARPYRKANSLQEALELMGRMVVDGHIDSELFELFIDDEVYLRYARENLPEDLIGSVDLGRVPGYAPPARRERLARRAS